MQVYVPIMYPNAFTTELVITSHHIRIDDTELFAVLHTYTYIYNFVYLPGVWFSSAYCFACLTVLSNNANNI